MALPETALTSKVQTVAYADFLALLPEWRKHPLCLRLAGLACLGFMEQGLHWLYQIKSINYMGFMA
jgi:hypothetical protein